MKKYYMCAYGGSIRYSRKCESEDAAAKYCFGVMDRVTVLCIGTRAPKYQYMARKALHELQVRLVALHKSRTGNDIRLG
jgi:hypothetical protein